jgi:short-subunit dehydrogenase
VKKILIVGAASAIAEAAARRFALAGDHLFLVARKPEQLEAVAADLRTRGAAAVHTYVMDANDFDAHPAMLDAAERALGGLDTALLAHGTLSDQPACERDVALAMSEIRTNALSSISLMTHLANRFEQQRHGTIAVISSVAGDRGRQSNYVYGSAKAMLTAFASGLRQRLFKSGVAVLTIKPGFVATAMTAHLSLPAKLTASADAVAADIVRAIDQRKDVIYTLWFWRVIMGIICALPEALFKKTKI